MTVVNVNRKYEKPWLQNSYLISTLKGMMISISHLFKNLLGLKKKITVEYPEERRHYSKKFKGLHILTKKDDGTIRCTSCMLCATACPADCIRIVASEDKDPFVEKAPIIYEIDLLRCVFCGYCEEACPVDAIRMGPEYDLADFAEANYIAGIPTLMNRPSLKGGVYSVCKDPPKMPNQPPVA